MVNPQTTSYDVVPYESLTFSDSHPDRLAVMATLFGMSPPPLDRARVLELGCAGGGNLVPMALAMPGGQFTGLDLSSRQIADAKALAARVGLTNVALHAMSFTEIGEEAGEFDYIIAHGIYSWITPALQEALLATIRRHLAPDGVAFVSYNTFPGWHARGMVRALMKYHARGAAGPSEGLRQARALLQGLAQALGDDDRVHARIIRDESKRVQTQSESYLVHEYMEDENHPVHFHEFAARAESNGLQYLAESQFNALAENQPPPVLAILDRLAAGDPIAREQYYDFLCNRYFRRTLLCHAGIPLRRPASPETLRTLRVASLLGPITPPYPFSTEVVEFRSVDGQATVGTDEPLLKIVMAVLTEHWPRSLPFADLERIVSDRLTQAPGPITDDPRALGEAILSCYAANIVDLHAHEPGFVTEVSEHPTASPLARLQAEAGPRLTNLRHRVVELGSFDLAVLRQLDGRRDRHAILDALAEAVASTGSILNQDGQPIRERSKVREILGPSLEPCLQRLATSALLVG